MEAAASVRLQWQADSLGAFTDLGSIGSKADAPRICDTHFDFDIKARAAQGPDSELRRPSGLLAGKPELQQHGNRDDFLGNSKHCSVPSILQCQSQPQHVPHHEPPCHQQQQQQSRNEEQQPLQQQQRHHQQHHHQQRHQQQELQQQQLQQQYQHHQDHHYQHQQQQQQRLWHEKTTARHHQIVSGPAVANVTARPHERSSTAADGLRCPSEVGSCSADSYASYITLAPLPSPAKLPELQQRLTHDSIPSAAIDSPADSVPENAVLASVRKFETPCFLKFDSQCSTPHIEPSPCELRPKDIVGDNKRPFSAMSTSKSMAEAAKQFWKLHLNEMSDSDSSDSDSDS
jgi:hypothetical protein